MKLLKIVVLFWLVFLSAQWSYAEELETVISTATRVDKNQADLIGSIASVSNDELAFINHQHIQQSLLRVAGVNVHRGNGQEYLPAIRSPVFTGAGACGAFLIAEDGIPLRAAGFCNVNELFEAHTEQAKRVEVTRGPGSSLYGSNALHGMVNVITPAVADEFVAVELGEDSYARFKGALAWTEGPVDFSALLTVAHDGGFRDESGYEQQKLTLRYGSKQHDYQLSGGLTVSNLDQQTAGFIRGLNAYKDTDLISSNPTPEAFRKANAFRAWLRFDKPLTSNKRLSITPYVRYTQMDFLQHFLPGDPLEENGQKSIGFQSGYYYDLNESNQLIVGLDAEYTNAYLTQSQQQATTGSAFLIETIPTGLHYDYGVGSSVYAPFVYLDVRPNKVWQLTAGLRYEHSRYDYDNKTLNGRTRADGSLCGFGGCRYSRPADSVDTFSNWSSHFGVAYNIGNQSKVYVNAARSFRTPQATELYRLQRAQNKADLNSVSLKSIEFGIKGNIDKFIYNIAVYRQNKDNVIFRDADFFNQSNGETKHQGLEVAAFMPLAHSFDLKLNASYAKHRYDYQQTLNEINIFSNDVDTAPRVFGSVQLGWLLASNTRVELEWVHMGEYYLDPENLHQYEGHDLLNFRIKTKFDSGFELSARLTNISDTRYAERADFTTFTNERYFPGRSRTGFIELKKNF